MREEYKEAFWVSLITLLLVMVTLCVAQFAENVKLSAKLNALETVCKANLLGGK